MYDPLENKITTETIAVVEEQSNRKDERPIKVDGNDELEAAPICRNICARSGKIGFGLCCLMCVDVAASMRKAPAHQFSNSLSLCSDILCLFRLPC